MHRKSLPQGIRDEVDRLEAEYPEQLVAVFDASRMYVYASARQEKVVGWRPDELTGGMGWHDVVAPFDHKHMELTWNDAELTGRSVDVSFSIRAKDGRDIKARGNSHRVTGDDGQRYWISQVWLV